MGHFSFGNATFSLFWEKKGEKKEEEGGIKQQEASQVSESVSSRKHLHAKAWLCL